MRGGPWSDQEPGDPGDPGASGAPDAAPPVPVPVPRGAHGPARGWLDAAVEVYARAMATRSTDLSARRELFAAHATEPGWRAVSAGDPPVAFAYGFTCRPGQWWHDRVDAGLAARPDPAARAWLADAFCVAELHVVPAWQRRGLGRRLLDRLLAPRTERTAVLSTPDPATAALGFYRALGWVPLLSGLAFPGSRERYTVLGLALADRAGPRHDAEDVDAPDDDA